MAATTICGNLDAYKEMAKPPFETEKSQGGKLESFDMKS